MTYSQYKRKSNKAGLTTAQEALIGIVGLVLVVAMCVGGLAYALSSGPDFERDCTLETYYVTSGDTLWTIGNRCVGDHCDVRIWIDEVTKMNNLGRYIYPGQSIDVWVYPDCDPYYGPQD